MRLQDQGFLGDTSATDPFQTGFRPCFGTKMTLVALVDDLCLNSTGDHLPSSYFQTFQHPVDYSSLIHQLEYGDEALWLFHSILCDWA